jgi:hydrogenase expression/formation protein HypE
MGFEPLDILHGVYVYMYVKQLEEGRAEVENAYSRVVRMEGNNSAQELIRQVFRVVKRKWRGIPISDEVQGACELLGLDPLHVANEGRFVAFIAPHDGERALQIMQSHPICAEASIIGKVSAPAALTPVGLVTMRSLIGAGRIVDMLSGEQLPRIC